MNSKSTSSSAGERLSFFKLFSEKKFKVEIPIIQRDYAQGRAHEYEVRETFLDALHEYLHQGKPNRDLDFVYGSLVKEGDSYRFVPLDGQQRLTTLFLLHWYLAQISNETEALRTVLVKNKKSQFTYETRTSSSEFCDALMACDIDMDNLLVAGPGGKNSLSKTIQDKGWFYLSWTHDPTIQSMLTMLDSIHSKFSGNPEYFKRLIDKDEPIITFLFLNLEEFNLTDDLYIKMNARGKALTYFENFKAKFEKLIKTFKNDLPHYELSFRDKTEPVDGHQYFIHKIDTDWADIFWAYRNTLSKDDTFDDELMNFISLIIANYHLLEKNKEKGDQVFSLDKFFGAGGKVRKLSFLEYNELGCFSPGLVIYLIEMMDLLHNRGLEDNKIKEYLNEDYYYSEDEVFRKVIVNNTYYQEKLSFYAFYKYLATWKDDSGLLEWMRVIYNLTENTIINTSVDYSKALISIEVLCGKDKSILNELRRCGDISGFHDAQVLEEKVKSHLIEKSKEWEAIVVDAEKHPFFRGQIGFVLSFSGILDFYNQAGHCKWDESQNDTYLADFKKYANSSSEVFSLIKNDSAAIDYLWERAVLTKGRYFTRASAGRSNILSARLAKNNIERDHSWKRLLRISVTRDNEWENRQDYVKAVFDDPYFDANNIKESLKEICEVALTNPGIEDWRKAFIRYSDLFKECGQGFIVMDGGEMLLLHESQRNHYHGELYSRVLDLEIKSEPDLVEPFKRLSYKFVKGREEKPFAALGLWAYKGKKYGIEIRFFSGQYELRFYAKELQEYADEIIDVLDKHRFIFTDNYDVSSYKLSCKTREESMKILKDFCSDLRGL